MTRSAQASAGSAKPLLRTLCVFLAAIAAVGAAPFITLTDFGLSAQMFAGDGNQTLRAAGYAFSIWGVIYLGLLIYATWQALPAMPGSTLLDAVAWPSVIAMGGCAAWLFAAALDAKLATVGIITVSAAAMILGLVRAADQRRRAGPSRLILWPLCLLAGWLTIASAINALTVLTAFGVIADPDRTAWALGGVAVVTLVGGGLVWRIGHLAYGLPIAWGLTAVWVAEQGGKPAVAAAALAGAGMVLVLSLVAGRPGRMARRGGQAG
jgi:hypothetical protein